MYGDSIREPLGGKKRMRQIIKQPFKNIDSKWEKLKRAIQEASKEQQKGALFINYQVSEFIVVPASKSR